jgi:hypothetical protein
VIRGSWFAQPSPRQAAPDTPFLDSGCAPVAGAEKAPGHIGAFSFSSAHTSGMIPSQKSRNSFACKILDRLREVAYIPLFKFLSVAAQIVGIRGHWNLLKFFFLECHAYQSC